MLQQQTHNDIASVPYYVFVFSCLSLYEERRIWASIQLRGCHIVMSYMRYIWTAMHSSIAARTSLRLLIVQQTGSCCNVYRNVRQWPIACDVEIKQKIPGGLQGNGKLWK